MDEKRIFHYFEEISRVPRGSYHNEKISQYLVNFAREHHLEYRVDEALNVIMKKPGSKGYEDKMPVMLQGHMDMVCVSEDESHDFENEGLSLRMREDYIDCEGTSLGGDDGIALAYCLALLDGDDYVHPPLEVVFTTDEEVGMDGALALDVSDLRAKRLINIDNEEEGILLVSCAGGASVDVVFEEEKEKVSGKSINVSVGGVIGGHSGTEIAAHPLNASLFLAKILQLAWCRHPFSMLSFEGGNKENVITNAASAQLVCDTDINARELYECLCEYANVLTEEIRSAQPDVAVLVTEPEETAGYAFTKGYTQCVLRFLNTVITGVQVMSSDVPGMVESSLNMGIAQTEERAMHFGFSLRSQKQSYCEYMLNQIDWLAQSMSKGQISYKFRVRGRYPAWDYRQDSPLRDCMVEVFQEMFGSKPRVEGIHAGLECGILASKILDLDIVSMGPDILDIHTVNERMSISSAKRNFLFLVKVLESLATE